MPFVTNSVLVDIWSLNGLKVVIAPEHVSLQFMPRTCVKRYIYILYILYIYVCSLHQPRSRENQDLMLAGQSTRKHTFCQGTSKWCMARKDGRGVGMS